MATYDFRGKTILVTGAGAGIGKAIVERLVASNAQVVALSLLQDELDVLKKELPRVRTVQVDLRDWNATRKAVEGVMPVDGLVNNAGVIFGALFLDATESDFDLTYDVNVKAVINVSQVVAKAMIANNIKGSIVNISSISAMTALEGCLVYGGSKGALQSSTRVMAAELGKYGIRVNSVNPTIVKTNMTRDFFGSELSGTMIRRTPLGRFAKTTEIASAVVFLLSDEASMVNGAPLVVDGGYLAN